MTRVAMGEVRMVERLTFESKRGKKARPDPWWKQAAQAVGVGFWHWDAALDSWNWTDPCGTGKEPVDDSFGRYGSILKLIHVDDRAQFDAATRGALETGQDCDLELRVVCPSGGLRWLLMKGHVLTEDGVRGMQGVIVDITRQKENQLSRQNKIQRKMKARLRLLASEVSDAEQRERARLAELLHDHLQQLLIAARFQVRSLGQLQEQDESIAERFRLLEELLIQSIRACRSLTVELSPLVLDKGLPGALQWLAGSMEQKHGLRVNLSTKGYYETANKDVEVVMFQAAQELLLNVVKHAGVSEAWLRMQRVSEKSARLTVRDKGRGLDPSRLSNSTRPPHGFGLASIKKRLEVVGGRMKISSKPGYGTQIHLTAPLFAADPTPAGSTADA